MYNNILEQKYISLIDKLCLVSFTLEEVRDILLIKKNLIDYVIIDIIDKYYYSFFKLSKNFKLKPFQIDGKYKKLLLKDININIKDAYKRLDIKPLKHTITLKELKTKNNILGHELANNCYIEPMMLSNYEKLKCIPTLLNALILAKFYDIDIRKIQWF